MGRSRELLRYAGTRLALAPLMLWLIASLVFLLLRLKPHILKSEHRTCPRARRINPSALLATFSGTMCQLLT